MMRENEEDKEARVKPFDCESATPACRRTPNSTESRGLLIVGPAATQVGHGNLNLQPSCPWVRFVTVA